MIYLASPYSDPDSAIREQRFEAACEATAVLMRQGQWTFSPIVNTHVLTTHGMPLDSGFWEPYNRELLSRCSELWVLMLPGWRESVGVRREVAMAEEMKLSVVYWTGPDSLDPSVRPR